MKKIALLAALLVVAVHVKSQESTFNQGDFVLNLGLGIGTSLYSGSGFTSILPPLSLSGEYGLINDFITEGMTFGVGGYLGFAAAEYAIGRGSDKWGWRYNYTVIGARAAVHYPLVENLDTYGGLMLSYNNVSVQTIGNVPPGFSPNSGSLGLSIYLGGRYYFNERFAGMAELGWGVAYVNLGVAFKF